MPNPGITSQYGFAFQKLVFILECLDKMSSIGARAIYEADDDVVVEDDVCVLNNSLSKIRTNESFIQCKTGEINKECFSRVIKNWLSYMNDDHQCFILFSESPCSFSFSDFKEIIRKEINDSINNIPRSNSILFRLRNKYINDSTLNETLFDNDFNRLVRNARIYVKNLDDVKQESINLLKNKHSYGEDTHNIVDFVFEERYEELKRIMFSEIDRRILKKQSYTIEFRELVGKLNTIASNISNNKFNTNFTTFKYDNKEAIDNMMAKNTREVNLLRKIHYQDTDAICLYLYEELYYSCYRKHYLDLLKHERIDSIEDAAHDEYIKAKGLNFELKNLFLYVCDHLKLDRYEDFVSQLKEGCFVFLSGDEAPDEYFIDWNGENAR